MIMTKNIIHIDAATSAQGTALAEDVRAHDHQALVAHALSLALTRFSRASGLPRGFVHENDKTTSPSKHITIDGNKTYADRESVAR